MTGISSRQQILANIRSSITANSSLADEKRMSIAKRRIAIHPRGVIPHTSINPRKSTLALFCNKVIASEASLQKVKSYGKVRKAISKYLRENNLPHQIKIGTDKRLQKIVAGKDYALDFVVGSGRTEDKVCLSHAFCGAAETGTLILTSGPENPTTLNFLPETHIVIINRNDIQKSYESVWKKLRRKFGKGNMPRTLNMITGPSRSADIEQTLILGAHGPLRLHVIVVNEDK